MLKPLFAAQLVLLAAAIPQIALGQKISPCEVSSAKCDTHISRQMIEIAPHVRNFIEWEAVSAAVPGVVENNAQSISGGISGNVLVALDGVGTPDYVYGVGGFQYDTFLEMDVKLADDTRVRSDVSMYGAGVGLRAQPRSGKVRAWGQVMIVSQWNSGKFTTDDGASSQEDTRTHQTFVGDYSAGVIYFPTREVGIEVGAGYNGQFDKKNADENFRIGVGLVFSARSLF